MMNFRLKLREQTDFCDPVGPSFKNAKKWKLLIEGNHIEFRAPKHTPMVKSKKSRIPESSYQYGDIIFQSNYNKDLHVANDWDEAILFYHNWAFNGPWFSGCLADLSMTFGVLKKRQHSSNISFFHPRAFEQTIADYLTNQFSKQKSHGKPKFIAPKNWQPVGGLPVFAARFQSETNKDTGLYFRTEYVFFPLDNQHLGVFIFYPNRYSTGTIDEINAKLGEGNINKLIDDIIDSIHVTLSAEAKLQQSRALEGLEAPSLTNSFPPLDWSGSKTSDTQASLTDNASR